jgi:hypothetical protein
MATFVGGLQVASMQQCFRAQSLCICKIPHVCCFMAYKNTVARKSTAIVPAAAARLLLL